MYDCWALMQVNMETELEQYLEQIGLTSDILKSVSPQVDDGTQPMPAAVTSSDNDKDDDAAKGQGDVITDVAVDAADESATCTSTVTVLDVVRDESDVTLLDCPAAIAALLIEDHDCCTAPAAADINLSTQTVCEDLAEQETMLSLDNSIPTSMLQVPYSADICFVESCQQEQTATVNGDITQLVSSEVDALDSSFTAQSSRSKPAVVFSTVPSHIDSAFSSQTSHMSSSCTIMLGGHTADVVASSPTIPRAATSADGHARSAAGRRTSLTDAMSYSSTIIRCSSSSAPIIATSTTKSRDIDAPATTAVVELDTSAPPAKPQIKTTRNYVSVVQVGSVPSNTVIERSVIPVTMMPPDCTDAGPVTTQNSPLAGHQHINISDTASGTPVKSSMKKVSPGHVKTKSVSFSTGSADDSDDGVLPTVASSEALNARRPDTHHPSISDAIARLDRDRVDGIVPRSTLVSDSGVFCEPDDDPPAPYVSTDCKVTTTQPARRTTVVVSGGTASIKNSLRHQQLGDVYTTTKLDSSFNSSPGNRTENANSSPRSVHLSAPTPASNNVSNTVETPQQGTTMPDVRRKSSDTTQQVTIAVIKLAVHFYTKTGLCRYCSMQALYNCVLQVAFFETRCVLE